MAPLFFAYIFLIYVKSLKTGLKKLPFFRKSCLNSQKWFSIVKEIDFQKILNWGQKSADSY